MAISLGLAALSVGGLHRLAPCALKGKGVILTLHRVRPFALETPGYAPNALLEITPEFLDRALTHLTRRGYQLVTLEEAVRRLSEPDARRFAALTFDDGYADFLQHALPALERHGAPATLFLCPGLTEGGARLWWLELEEAIRRLESVKLDEEAFAALTPAQKSAAYERVYWRLRALSEAQLLAATARLAESADVREESLRRGLFMTWSQIEELARHPLISIGAHGMAHLRLAQWPEALAHADMAGSRQVLETRLGRAVTAFCYPVGDSTSAGPREFALAAELGFSLGVTTRPGLLFPEHAAHRLALPRVSLNGLHQNLPSLDALLSGAPFYVWNRGKRVNVT